ncbi:MAG: AAA family ATPase [Candidatus Saccharibacteria bacterium]|nr:AAA family ATPase [Candidatus Saccharibacteria bacterium]
MNNSFNPKSHRAREAAFRKKFEKLEFPLIIVIALLAIVGVCLLTFAHTAFGWLPIAFVPWILMLVLWMHNELKHIPLGKTDDINDILSGDVMTILCGIIGKTDPEEIIPNLVSGIIDHTKSGRFLFNRFGLSNEFFIELFSTHVNAMHEEHKDNANHFASLEEVFASARNVRAKDESRQIGGGDLLIAIIESCMDYDIILKRYNLDPEDLYAGMTWFNYLYNLTKIEKKPLHSGGIARDLNFGYIPTLQQFGRNLSTSLSHSARSQIHYTKRGEALDKMIQIFSGNMKQNVALIGPEGSGRSIIVKAFAEALLDEDSKLPTNLRYRQVFQLEASALLAAAGNERGNIERLLTKVFNEAYAAKNIIIYLNDAQLFFKEGTGSVDLTNLIMPIIDAGNLRIILSIEEQEFLELSSRAAGIANQFNRVNIVPTNQADTMHTMEDQVPSFEARFNVMYDYRALKEAYRLGDRYVTDRAQPGRALRLLEISAAYAENGIVTANSISSAVEKTLGVKVKVADNSDERERLLNMEQHIHERMVDQVAAVKTVSSALRRAAAGVRNENRPIGTFLFLGPTGVGKTELAKAISEVYFNGEKEIARLDLNEFVNANDVSRLIADGAVDEHSLTAQVSKRPFSVVLLDEIEKAHPQVLTTLLQVLDEGVLRDVKNREISFRDTIIIATSNAGADLIREYISQGVDLPTVKDKLMDQLISNGEFKPEFLNRFDEVCIFTPLSPENLLKIVELLLKGVNKTLAPQKISVSLNEEAKKLLVEVGYDPLLGARPMRRIIQKTIENLVAKAILAGSAETGAELTITAEDISAELESQKG